MAYLLAQVVLHGVVTIAIKAEELFLVDALQRRENLAGLRKVVLQLDLLRLYVPQILLTWLYTPLIGVGHRRGITKSLRQ